jgi:hypothetical protein
LIGFVPTGFTAIAPIGFASIAASPVAPIDASICVLAIGFTLIAAIFSPLLH